MERPACIADFLLKNEDFPLPDEWVWEGVNG